MPIDAVPVMPIIYLYSTYVYEYQDEKVVYPSSSSSSSYSYNQSSIMNSSLLTIFEQVE